MKPELLGVSLTRLILAVSIMVLFGALLGAAGYLVNNKQVMISQPEILSTLEQSAFIKDEIKDWKTYNNPEEIFSFKYPADWNIENESESVVSVGSGNDNTITVGVGGGSPNTSLEDNVAFLKNSLDKIKSSYRELDNLQIAEARVFLDSARLEGTNQVYVVTSREVISITYMYYKYPEITDAEKEKFLLEKFMPTFVLGNNSNSSLGNISDWKTYRNEKYMFGIDYPSNWKFYGVTDEFTIISSHDLDPTNLGSDSNEDGVNIQIHAEALTKTATLNEFYNEMSGNQSADSADAIGHQSLLLNGYNAYKQQMYNAEFYLLLSNDGKTKIKINIQKGQSDSFNGVADQILSTFKFTEKYSAFFCGNSTATDIDNNIYNTVQIGSQCWLKENLKVTKNPEGKPIIRYCYDNDPKICDTDGGLYDWNTAMNNSTSEGWQGVCPSGWHVPKDSEWYVLENYLKDEGRTCISTRGGMWNSIKNGGWDCNSAGTKLKMGGSSGFDGILAGYRDVSGELYYQTSYAYFWSSTQSGLNAWGRFLNLGLPQVLRNRYNKNTNFSVRCLKD